MAFSPPQCAVNMEQRLAALRRDQEIDGLRVYLIKYNLFPRNRDPENSPIRIEELKELVKHWKLHRQRGFWRDHPEKDDLVRALLQHIRSEAANKKRRQEAQEKYSRTHKGTAPSGGVVLGSGEISDAAKRDLSMILSGGKEAVDDGDIGDAKGSFLRNRMGGDLFYQRGSYDEGMIYLSRVDKSRFATEDHNPRNELFTTATAAPTPLGLLVHMGNGSTSPRANNHDKLPPSPSQSHATHATTAALSRDMKLKSVEGLFNVSCHRGFEAQMLREGALATIASVLKTDDAAVRLLAAATLLNLTANAAPKELYAKMMDDGVVAALLELAHTAHPLVKTFCARALFRFTSDESHHFRMVHEGVVVALTQLMTAVPGDDDHRQAAVHALVNLAAVPRAVTCDAVLTTLIAIAKNVVSDTDAPASAARLRGCAQALLNLSILPTTRSSMIDEGAMVALSLVASTKQLPFCETVSSVLCNCASIRTNQELMMKNNAAALVADLLDLVTASLAHVQAQAQADEQEDAELITTARALLERMRRNCVNVLAHFCCNAKLHTRVLSAGCIPKLLAIARLGERGPLETETEKFCILSLANLALEDRCRPPLVQEGAVPLLLRILNEPTPADDDSRTLLKLDCVTALSHLMLHPKNFARMVDEGVVPALLALVQHSENAAIQRACVYAMLNMAQDPAMKTRLAQATASDAAEPGAIPTMLAFASKQLLDAELCTVCLSFFEHLSTRQENYDVLYYEGVVGLLVRVLQKKSTAEPVSVIYALWLSAMTTLSHLANHPDKRATFLDDGVLEAVQHVLAAANADTRRRDARLETKVVRLQLAAAQIVCKLQELCCGPKKTDVPAFFASLLLLATQSAAKNSRLERRAVHMQQKTVLRCALALARCATLSQRGRRVLAAQVDVPPALNGIMRTGLHEAQVCAAIALCNLATERGSLKPRLWRDATTDDFIVITLLRLNSDETKEICAKALFNLLTHDDARAQLIHDGALSALIKLSARLESEEIRDLALRSIYNITLVGSAQQQLLLDMEIVRVLAKLYQPEFSKEMKRLLCGILSNLSSVAGHESQLLREGALALLKHLAKVRDPETKVYAANMLYNLSCCPDVLDLLVRGSGTASGEETTTTAATMASATGGAGPTPNVLSLLIALLKAEHRDVRRYAARTVANLTSSSLAVQLMTEGETSTTSGHGGALVTVLNDVLKRTMAACLETSAACVFALRNLLTQAINRQRLIDANGVVTLAAILSCADMETETRTLVVATDLLCGLANLDTGGGDGLELRLVKDGIVKALHAIARGSGESAAVSMNIATSLSHLSRHRACHDVMLRDGALETLTLLARTSASATDGPFKNVVAIKGEDFCHHAMVMLRNLVHQNEATDLEILGQRLAGQPLVVPLVLALASSTSAETREHVAVTLHNVALHRRCRQLLLKHDGVKILLRLATNATTLLKRHVCGLALQLLSKHGDASDDPHVAKIKQEGLVAALAALAEPHHSDVLVLATQALHALVEPRVIAMKQDEDALLATGHAPVAQQGAPPDWANVLIPNMAAWPALETLATSVNAGTDDHDDDEDDDDDESDDEATAKPASPAQHSRLRVPSRSPSSAKGSMTLPRVCSVDTVLGTLHLLHDESLDKVCVNVDAEVAMLAQQRRTSSANGSSRDELPALQTRPASAPDAAEEITAEPKRRTTTSTLSLARHEVATSPQPSPLKSPLASSTPKRKSRTLEPLLGASASTPVL